MAEPLIFPKVPADLSSIIKPEELVDIVEMTPLTLQDRRIYNMLIGNAWNDIFSQPRHTISRKKLTEFINSNNQDIEASLRRLMSAIVQIKIRRNSNGDYSTRQIALLGANEVESRGEVTYSFSSELIDIIKYTQIFARLHTKVMFQLSSKYSLAIYEFLQRRKNLQHINFEVMTVKELRGLLGVGQDKLIAFGHLNDRALKPAADEISFLTEYEIQITPMRQGGRAVSHVKISWQRKVDIGAQIEAVEELERSKLGRKARMQRNVDALTPAVESSQICDSSYQDTDFHLSVEALEAAKKIVLQSGAGLDIYSIEREFYQFAQKKGRPQNPDGAFIGFVRQKLKQPA